MAQHPKAVKINEDGAVLQNGKDGKEEELRGPANSLILSTETRKRKWESPGSS